LGIPSLDEQQMIVAYLDEETTRIDNLIKKNEQIIRHYREVITLNERKGAI
jgi:restriction endonuclease S subunit